MLRLKIFLAASDNWGGLNLRGYQSPPKESLGVEDLATQLILIESQGLMATSIKYQDYEYRMRPPNKGHLLAPHTTELKRCFEPGTAPASVIVAGEQGYEVSINVHGTFVLLRASHCK